MLKDFFGGGRKSVDIWNREIEKTKWYQATVIRCIDIVGDRDSCGWDSFSAYAEDLNSRSS
jgi:hypothetical protein